MNIYCKRCHRKMYPTPIENVGEVWSERIEYDCSNPLCSNYGIILEQELSWKKRFILWIHGLKKNVTDFAHSTLAWITARLKEVPVPFKRY